MSDPAATTLEYATAIVVAYLTRHDVPRAEISALVAEVRAALDGEATAPASEPAEIRQPRTTCINTWSNTSSGSRGFGVRRTVTSFTKVRLRGWRQFESIDLDLDRTVVVLTGVNGSGKTTLLRLLAHYVGFPASFLATPRRAAEDGKVAWWSGFSESLLKRLGIVPTQHHEIGAVSFSEGITSQLTVPVDVGGPQVPLNQSTYVNMRGLFIGSHRPNFNYSAVTTLEMGRQERRHAYENYKGAVTEITETAGGGFLRLKGVSTSIKNTLLNWGYVGYGSKVAPADPELIANFEGFQRVLATILPAELRFQRYEIRSGSEIVFICRDSEFLLETVSGGISSLIHLAWMLFNFDDGSSSTVLIDEIENHLHPSLQRIVLPNLTAAFPNLRFVVSTHSPLVVSSVRGAKVYALKHGQSGGIVHEELDFSNDAQTAADVLDNVLGVPVTIPTWAEQEYEAILDRYISKAVDEIDLHAFRDELRARGLKNFVLQGVERVLEAKQ